MADSIHPNMLRGLAAGRARRWPARTLAERLWEKVTRGAASECWEWRGGLGSSGYGTIKNEANRVRASHRVAYEVHHGVALNSEQHVCHSCDNRKCCNPAHLWIGTNSDNVADRVRKGRSGRAPRSLSDGLVRSLAMMIGEGFTNKALAAAYSVKENRISEIRHGKRRPVGA
jgi:hypothetical protein